MIDFVMLVVQSDDDPPPGVWMCRPGVDLGRLPEIIRSTDPRPAREQVNERYGGGWDPMGGFTLRKTEKGYRLMYPGDPPMLGLAFIELPLSREMVVLFESDWVVVVQEGGSWEASRMT
jgi:hypothetical protein